MTIIKRIKPSGREFDYASDPEQAKRAMKAWYLSSDSQAGPVHR